MEIKFQIILFELYIYMACLKPKTWDKSREQKYLLIKIHD